MFKYVSLSLSRGCLNNCNLWFPGFSPLISWTRFNFFILFCKGFFWWWVSLHQVFPCLIVELVDSIEGCSPFIPLIVIAGLLCWVINICVLKMFYTPSTQGVQ